MSGQNSIVDCESCIQGWKSFHILTDKELQLINDNRYEATFKPGEIMLKQGSPSSNTLFMANGMAKIYVEGIADKNFILGIALPGQIIAGPGAFVNSRYSYSVAALTSVKACFISFDIIISLAKQNGDFAESLLRDLSNDALRSHIKMVNLAHKRMPGRLAEALIYFADEIYKSDKYEMILSRQELGDITNMAKECVVRILKDFEDSGVVYSDSSKIKILDKDKLIQISEKG